MVDEKRQIPPPNPQPRVPVEEIVRPVNPFRKPKEKVAIQSSAEDRDGG
jgi:hypothetical protein